MQQLLAVGIGGFAGAVARYAVTGLVHKKFPGFLPAGTLAVNLLGCLAIGILMTLIADRVWFSNHDNVRLFLITGFLGSLTTFSTFGYETINLITNSDFRMAFWNVAANLFLGCLAVWIGHLIVKASGF